jgi:hypothetical protein
MYVQSTIKDLYLDPAWKEGDLHVGEITPWGAFN